AVVRSFDPLGGNTVLGRLRKFATRLSGSGHADGGSVGSLVQLVSPVAPVVRGDRSDCSMPCVMMPSSLVENVFASKGGTAGAGSFCSCASVTGTGGTPPTSGVGRYGAYAVLFGLVSLSVSMKNLTGSMVPIL